MFERRSRMEVTAKILESAMKGARKTQIMSRSGINYKQAENFLNFLMQKKLLKVTNLGNKNNFHTTVKGLRYLREFNDLKKTLLDEMMKEAHV